MMLWAALVLTQTAVDAQIVPASLPRQRAELAFRRAEEGQSLARRYICNDPQRLRNITELAERFGELRTLFSIRFGTSWRGDMENDPAGIGRQSIDDPGRRDDCRLRDSFGAGIMDFENALRRAQSELGPLRYGP